MNDDLEQKFQKLRDDLYDSYLTSKKQLESEDETAYLTPILSTLKNEQSRYETPTLIAEGGEKRVYRAYDRHLNRYVAMAQSVKAESALDQEQFLREGQLTANLTHPNIVPIYNMGIRNDGVPFFSMELIPGDSLKDIVRSIKNDEASYRTRYPLDALLNIFNKVCDAVAYAHSRSVLHLDIKPDNIRVGQFGEVFLCDWGLARIDGHIESGETKPGELDGDILNDMTLTGITKGSPGYMAPEQVTNTNKSPQTDIYALGAILYLLLTHKLPVDGKSANEVLENTELGNIIHPSRRNLLHSAPTGLTAVCLKAMALNPSDRYKSVQDLQFDINRFLSHYPTEAQQANLLTRAVLLTQRHRKITLWLLAFLSVLAIVMSINVSIIHKQKGIAEDNFYLYRAEHEESKRIHDKLTALSFQTQTVRSYTDADRMLPVSALLLQQKNLSPAAKQSLLFHKARMHMVLQQFNAAVNAFEQMDLTKEPKVHHLDICREFAAIKPLDNELLSERDLARLLANENFTIHSSLALLTYYHDRMNERPRNPNEHIQVVAAALAQLNGIDQKRPLPQLKLTHRPEGRHLDLSHTRYSTYRLIIPMTWPKNVFGPLNLYSLDISHTPVSLVRELWGMKLKELRMVGVFLEPTHEIAETMMSIEAERVILGRGDYSKDIIADIRAAGIEVVEEEYKSQQSGVR